MADQETRHYEVPARIRSFVYLVGMLGFPVVVASYVLVVLSGDLRTVDRRLTELSTRIDDKPMGLDRSSDFIIYLTSSLHQELIAKLPRLVDEINFASEVSREAITRSLSRIDRRIESYVRPIVRKHKRFAERFPTAGGNIGSMFVLTAPSENVSAGDSEAYLTGQTHKDFGESLTALLSNIFVQFGHAGIISDADIKRSAEKLLTNEQKKALDMLLGGSEGDDPRHMEDRETEAKSLGPNDALASGEQVKDTVPNTIQLMSSAEFKQLAALSISTAVTALRDQMLVRIRLQSSELDQPGKVRPMERNNYR